MAKEAYYFSHDSNARHDPKIGAMRSVYGSEGYGWFWILVEMMRESEDYKLDMQGKYIFNAYAMQMHSDSTTIERYVHDCIQEFGLFNSDGNHFWSESLLRRMQLREQTSEKRRAAANKRWKNTPKTDESMQMHSNSNANGMQGKESKLKESKGNEIKEKRVEEPASPTNLESIKSELFELIQNCKIKEYNLHDLDVIYSFIGVCDVEVIQTAIKKGSDKDTLRYAIRTLERMVKEGKTKKEHVQPKIEVGQAPSNVTTFKRGSSKPNIPTVSSSETEGELISPEELAEIKALAKKFEMEGSNERKAASN